MSILIRAISFNTLSNFPAWYNVLTFHVANSCLLVVAPSRRMTVGHNLEHITVPTGRGTAQTSERNSPFNAVFVIIFLSTVMIFLGRIGFPAVVNRLTRLMCWLQISLPFQGHRRRALPDRLMHPIGLGRCFGMACFINRRQVCA